MSLMLRPLARYFDFKGRARRSEYWQFFLLQTIAYGVLMGIVIAAITSGDAGAALIGSLVGFGGMALCGLGFLIPQYAVTVRRLHDSNRSGWWLLLYLPGMLSSFSTWNAIIAMARAGNASPDPAILAQLMQGTLLGLVSMVCGVVMLVFMFWPGTRGANRFGPDPKNSGPDISVFEDERSDAHIDEVIARAKAEADAARPAHTPVFDFGPGSTGPMINTYGREANPEPTPAPARTTAWQAPAYDPGVRPAKPFGRRT